MKIAAVHLSNFKRFAATSILNIPESAKLILVVGPNGCGKSSLFDAFLIWHRSAAGMVVGADESYYRKALDQRFDWNQSVKVILHGSTRTVIKGSLYVRTAYRNDPDFSITGIQQPKSPADGNRNRRAIDNDQTVSDNYQRLLYDTMSGVYDTANDTKTVRVLREELIGSVRTSMKNVFGDLLLNNISDPLGKGAFSFEKGLSKQFHYKNLSGGEKSAFDLLLDLHLKRKFFPEAIYCIDEIETHLHTRVQGRLLKEIVSIIPSESQLWITTHSLGVMRASAEIAYANPASVCVIDFDGVDSDEQRQIMPSNLGRITWEKLFSIALDDLSTRIAPKHIVVCEGSSVGSRRKNFDAEIYNRIFELNVNDILFISGGGSSELTKSGISIQAAISKIAPSAKIWTLMDRDDRSDQEVKTLEEGGTLVLNRRNLESYLLCDEVLEALALKEGKGAILPDIRVATTQAFAASVARGNPPDDFKSAAGEIFVACKKLLALTRCGNSTDAFMQDTAAPLIKPNMKCYEDLKATIADKILNDSAS